MALQAMWVHGHSASIELSGRTRNNPLDNVGFRWGSGPFDGNYGFPFTFLLGLRLGWGVEYRGQDNSDYWFHFAIPTLVINAGVRSRFRRATVLFNADTGVTLSSVHVWDGPNRVAQQDGLAIGGLNISLIDGRNSFALPDKEVFWGAGISVQMHFADVGSVVLHAAGIDFES